MSRILMVVTSADRIDPRHETGVWLEEFAVPWLEFTTAGLDVAVASPQGGAAPVDPRSLRKAKGRGWERPLEVLARTERLTEQRARDFEAIFFPGGHGPLMDLPENGEVQRLVREIADAGKVVAAMCHGPAALLNVRLADGGYLVEGRRVTCYTDEEERAAGLAGVVPFLLEDALRRRGAVFVAKAAGSAHVERDGHLVTGQNPASSRSTARAVVEAVAASARPSRPAMRA